LKAELALFDASEWISHFNTRDYTGGWSGIPLRSPGGVAYHIVPDIMGYKDFQDTPFLARCTYIPVVLATFQCPLKAVRLLNLHAGSSIREHVDHDLDYEHGEVRLHIPVQTNHNVAFYLNGVRLFMEEGECWYTNVNLPHRVDNTSATDRIHLVIDCAVNDWLRTFFKTASSVD